jgi:copper transport protein
LGALPVTLTSAGPGAYRADALVVPLAGQWRLRLTIRSDDFDETTVELPVPVR